jgi:hypothetical protein
MTDRTTSLAKKFVAYIASRCVEKREKVFDLLVNLAKRLENSKRAEKQVAASGNSLHPAQLQSQSKPQSWGPSYIVESHGRCHGSHPETQVPSSGRPPPGSARLKLQNCVDIFRNYRERDTDTLYEAK